MASGPPLLCNSFLLTAHARNSTPLRKGEPGAGDRVAGLAGCACGLGLAGWLGWLAGLGWVAGLASPVNHKMECF